MSEEDARDEKKTDPLATVWRWTTVLAGVLALSNMVSDLVHWIEQIEAVLAVYRKVVNFIWWPIDWALPFNVPAWIKDYLTIGAVFVGAQFKAMDDALRSQYEKEGSYYSSPIDLHLIFQLLYALVVYPLTFVISLIFLLRRYFSRGHCNETDEPFSDSKILFSTIQWFGATLLGFFVLLVISTAFTLAGAS